jgi:hypothetical protein
MNLKLKNLRTPAVLTAAAAIAVLTQGAASASTTHRAPQPTEVSSYTCSNAVTEVWTGSGDIWGKSCELTFTVTGPAKSVVVSIASPKREVAYLNYQIQELPVGQENSALGSDFATVRIPTLMSGYSGNERFNGSANSVVPSGDEMLAWIAIAVPSNDKLPTATVTASS